MTSNLVYIKVLVSYYNCFIAATVIKNIDFSVHPCDNFYEYACGGWMKKHFIPEDRSRLAKPVTILMR
ncbi:hypothetical protein KUTeg_001837 [Tegillarca granosa]|uniref:Peptidase M13 N-terminal domain-containing protein n=1 Tax=Tegillarca granosa TaxID=220873 RepID=A0ABQ9FWX1_TEGGR|nr:hypothetical protein KUTeg_001837 [Tegillarca granosa]